MFGFASVHLCQNTYIEVKFVDWYFQWYLPYHQFNWLASAVARFVSCYGPSPCGPIGRRLGVSSSKGWDVTVREDSRLPDRASIG